MGTWTLTIHEVPPSGNVTMRMHHRVYSRLLERWFLLIRAAPGFLDIPQATGRRRVEIWRHGVRSLDRDNLHSAMKPIVDVLRPPKHEEGHYKSGKRQGEYWSRRRIGHALILDDDEAHLELLVHNGPNVKPGQKALVLRITDLPA